MNISKKTTIKIIGLITALSFSGWGTNLYIENLKQTEREKAREESFCIQNYPFCQSPAPFTIKCNTIGVPTPPDKNSCSIIKDIIDKDKRFVLDEESENQMLVDLTYTWNGKQYVVSRFNINLKSNEFKLTPETNASIRAPIFDSNSQGLDLKEATLEILNTKRIDYEENIQQ